VRDPVKSRSASEPSVVRIVVFESAGDDSATRSALERIGAEVEFVSAFSVADCAKAVAAGDVDLVVPVRVPSSEIAAIQLAFGGDAPPIVAVIDSQADESAALDAFRAGAGDCVRETVDYAEVLPVVALEQIRRWRQQRARAVANRKIAWLERLQDAIVNQIPVSLIVLDVDGRVVDVNPEFCRAFDVVATQVRGTRLEDVLPWDLLDSGALQELIPPTSAQLQSGSRLARMRAADGGSRVYDVRGQRLDEAGRVLIVLSDVSQTELLSRRVDALERYNENIVLSINSALLVIDLAGRITFANPTAGQILGRASADLVGRFVSDWFSPFDDGPSLLSRTLDEGLRFKGAEAMIRLDSGAALPIGISCTPLIDDDGRTQGAVAIFQDLSEIKQLQQQVLQQEKMASIGQLAAGVAHEINNPMGFIHANLYQMSEYLEDLAGYLDAVDELRAVVADSPVAGVEAAAHKLSEIGERIDIGYLRGDFSKAVRESQEGSERIRHIVRDLRDFSHRGSAERSLADVNQCVDTTANIVFTMMKDSVAFEKQYADLRQLRCYPMELKQVFMNILVNAYQAIEEGRSRDGARGLIRIVTSEDEEGITVRISDTGVGISEADRMRIFEPFFSTKEVGVGTGLGLSTSYAIIERHGGRMTVESVVGEGSTFSVWLPFETSLTEAGNGASSLETVS
jgi:two-component system NtrC family sensor kinase